MSIRAQKGLRMFPRGSGVAFGAHLGRWVFPSYGEMSIRAQKGLHVFPGASRVAGGAHFGVHLGIQLMAEPQTILSAVLGKRKNAPV